MPEWTTVLNHFPHRCVNGSLLQHSCVEVISSSIILGWPRWEHLILSDVKCVSLGWGKEGITCVSSVSPAWGLTVMSSVDCPVSLYSKLRGVMSWPGVRKFLLQHWFNILLGSCIRHLWEWRNTWCFWWEESYLWIWARANNASCNCLACGR